MERNKMNIGWKKRAKAIKETARKDNVSSSYKDLDEDNGEETEVADWE